MMSREKEDCQGRVKANRVDLLSFFGVRVDTSNEISVIFEIQIRDL